MSSVNSPIRIFLCDDAREFRELIRLGLDADGGFDIVGEAGDGVAGVAGVSATQPDVVLLDLAMPELDGLEALTLIREQAPGAKVVVLSGFAAARMERE